MKSLVSILGGIFFGIGSIFMPMKAHTQDFYGAMQIGIKAEMDLSPIYQEDYGNVDSGALIDIGAEARLGFGYSLNKILDLKIGGQFDFSFNGDLTGGTEGYFELVSKTPPFCPNVGAFARASFFDKFLFMEYSVNFFNQCSRLTGERSFEVEDTSTGMVDIDEHRDIKGRDILAGYIDHKIIFGQHMGGDTFIDLYAGICIPQIIYKTSLWDDLEMKASPTFTIGGRIGFANE